MGFTVKHTMEEEEWDAHVFGSGAFQWEWWHSASEVNGLIELVAFTDKAVDQQWEQNFDPYQEGNTEKWVGTFQELADIATEYAAKDQFVMEQLVNDDFDADGMDRVCQYAVFGEVPYA